MKFWFIGFVVFLAGFAFCTLTDDDKRVIGRTAMVISNCGDLSPDLEYWENLQAFGPEAIPVVVDLIHTAEVSRVANLLVLLSQMEGDDAAVYRELRSRLEAAVGSGADAKTTATALLCFEKRCMWADYNLFCQLETHTNGLISTTAKRVLGNVAIRLVQVRKREEKIDAVIRNEARRIARGIDSPEKAAEMRKELFRWGDARVAYIVSGELNNLYSETTYGATLFDIVREAQERTGFDYGLLLQARHWLWYNTGKITPLHSAAFRYLGDHGQDVDLPFLRKLATSTNESIRVAAAREMERLGTRLAVEKGKKAVADAAVVKGQQHVLFDQMPVDSELALSYEEPEDPRTDRIISLATIIAGHFDSSPDRKYWNELRSFGADAIPVLSKFMCDNVGASRSEALILVFSQLKGNDRAVLQWLRDFLKSESRTVDEVTLSSVLMALNCLSRVGEQEDVSLLRSFETDKNMFVAGTAKSARIKLEQRLEQQATKK